MCSLSKVVLLSLLTTSTAVSLYRRVVGGRLIGKNEHDFLVSLWFMPDNIYTENTKLHHVCGGALIAPSWVLTAAHCYDARVGHVLNETDNWRVVLGKHNQRLEEDTNQFRNIKSLHMYHEWNYENITGDAALLELDSPVDLSRDGVAVIDYDTDPLCAVPGQICTVLGWGQAAESPYGYGLGVPVAAEVPVIDESTCREAFRPVNTDNIKLIINNMTLCAGHSEGDVDACNGDSGGPLVCECNDTLVISGIMSKGLGCAREHLYGIYTRVTLLNDWIREVLDGNDPQPPEHPHVVL